MSDGTLNLSYYKPRLLIIVIIGLSVVINWLLSYLCDGLFQDWGFSGIILLILYIYNRWLWEYPVLNYLVDVPNLNGEYKGTIEYNYKDSDEIKECFAEIKQTASHIRIKSFFTKKDENSTISLSKGAFFLKDSLGDYCLGFYYQNLGSCKNGDTLNQHEGFNYLSIKIEKGKTVLEGYYFTNRGTKGCIKLIKTKEKQ